MSATDDSRPGTVLVVDVAGASQLADFETDRDLRLAALNRRHHDRGWVARPYTVTAWDEFQSVLELWSRIPEIILDIRLEFAPLEVYVGVGHGAVSGWSSPQPMNLALSGAAFTRARRAVDAVKASRSSRGGKFRRLTSFVTGDEQRDALLCLVYGLHDTLVQQISDRQWEMIGATHRAESQDAVARLFDVEPSTVTRNLQRGHYWQLKETVATLSDQMSGGALALQSTIRG